MTSPQTPSEAEINEAAIDYIIANKLARAAERDFKAGASWAATLSRAPTVDAVAAGHWKDALHTDAVRNAVACTLGEEVTYPTALANGLHGVAKRVIATVSHMLDLTAAPHAVPAGWKMVLDAVMPFKRTYDFYGAHDDKELVFVTVGNLRNLVTAIAAAPSPLDSGARVDELVKALELIVRFSDIYETESPQYRAANPLVERARTALDAHANKKTKPRPRSVGDGDFGVE